MVMKKGLARSWSFSGLATVCVDSVRPNIFHGKASVTVCHQAFFAKRELAIEELYNLKYRFFADFDWCIRIMKKSKILHDSHLTTIDYLNEGMTTRNHRASLKERFRIMCKHYGYISTVMYHIWFVVRAVVKR